ncbi:purine-cytosine permease family protein [Alicyclobacillus sacchari]|uniref:purine-cytosine permease family protein n=1 Tax=Alicyclobacillus sacchari TaxID=392010 RepID=UPI0024E15A27|nr:hypothetical protein [Alicyclobacillus sacchari]
MQIGEQVDYLRFMPNLTSQNRNKWWLAVMFAGPGWVILGAIKQLGGSLLASWIDPAMGSKAADEPIRMYTQAFHTVIGNGYAALALATFFVLLSQIKINVTNAYSGSLSWSNFFSRIFHSHPGRIVWLFLNVGISLGLMEAGVFGFLNTVLGFYSNLAVAWIGAVVSDLVINKGLLKISPSYIEFKRGHLYNFNPVGFGSMIIAASVSIAAFFGAFGLILQAYSPFLSFVLAFVLAPVIALVTRGKYYIARENAFEHSDRHHETHKHSDSPDELTCASCGFVYEKVDVLYCPFHKAPICSLCCSLESACHDLCKTSVSAH